MTIQVILADDQPLIRAGLRRLIDQTPDIDVAGEAGTGAEAVRLARESGADVVVMDIRMPGTDGIEATRLITAAGPHARVLLLHQPGHPPRPMSPGCWPSSAPGTGSSSSSPPTGPARCRRRSDRGFTPARVHGQTGHALRVVSK